MKIRDNIILRSDIPEYLTQRGINLKRSGKEYRCPCPIHHGTREDSFSCTSKKWFCFGCIRGGSIIELHMELEGVSFIQAIRDLAEYYDIEIENDTEYIEARSYFAEREAEIVHYERQQDKVLEYLKQKRGLSCETIKNLRYGYNPEHGSIVIPIRNADGMIVAKAERNFR